MNLLKFKESSPESVMIGAIDRYYHRLTDGSLQNGANGTVDRNEILITSLVEGKIFYLIPITVRDASSGFRHGIWRLTVSGLSAIREIYSDAVFSAVAYDENSPEKYYTDIGTASANGVLRTKNISLDRFTHIGFILSVDNAKGSTLSGYPLITITQNVQLEENAWKKEAWEIYYKDTLCYTKDKTIDNCWREYGIVNANNSVNNTTNRGSFEIPVPVDLTDDNIGEFTWNRAITNKTFWNKIISWYTNHEVSPILPNQFSDSNIGPAINIYLKQATSGSERSVNLVKCFQNNPEIETIRIRNVNKTLDKINLTNAFTNCTLLASISFLDKDTFTVSPRISQCKEAFKGCSSLTKVPTLATSEVSDFTGMLEGCTALESCFVEVGSSVTPNFTRMFSGCSALKYITAPIPFDNVTVLSQITDMFRGCYNLENAALRNVGHYLNLDFSSFNMGLYIPKLVSGSIKYLLDNLTSEAGTLNFPREWIDRISYDSARLAVNNGWTLQMERDPLIFCKLSLENTTTEETPYYFYSNKPVSSTITIEVTASDGSTAQITINKGGSVSSGFISGKWAGSSATVVSKGTGDNTFYTIEVTE